MPAPAIVLTLRVTTQYDDPDLGETLQDASSVLLSPAAAAALLRQVAEELDPPRRPPRG